MVIEGFSNLKTSSSPIFISLMFDCFSFYFSNLSISEISSPEEGLIFFLPKASAYFLGYKKYFSNSFFNGVSKRPTFSCLCDFMTPISLSIFTLNMSIVALLLCNKSLTRAITSVNVLLLIKSSKD